MEERSLLWKTYHGFFRSCFCLNFITISLRLFAGKVQFANFKLHNFWIKSMIEGLWYTSLQSTPGGNFANFQANSLTFDTQTTCLKRPCFCEIWYAKKEHLNIFCLLQAYWSFCNRLSLTLFSECLDIHNWSDCEENDVGFITCM